MSQPCTCLCLASLLQITRTTPWRRMILQSLHIFLTEALTFTLSFTFLEWLLEAFHDSAPSGVVGGHLDLDPVPGKESQVTPAHTP